MNVEKETDEEYQCPSCNHTFSEKKKYNKHLETHDLTCNSCNLNFKSYNQKKKHLKSQHSQEKIKYCGICPDTSFKTENEYLVHVRDIHKGKQVDYYMCNVCGKTFKRRTELKQHINSKCGTEKLFTCKICNKKLMSPGSLYNHMRRHDEKANFMCPFCAKAFHTAGQLTVHERIHTQQKVFVCDLCGKGFCHRQSLITHSTIHTGIKPFQCEGCGKSFSCVGNLLKHRKTYWETCGLAPMTSHTVKNPSTRIKIKINTPASAKLREAKRDRELREKLSKLDSRVEKTVAESVFAVIVPEKVEVCTGTDGFNRSEDVSDKVEDASDPLAENDRFVEKSLSVAELNEKVGRIRVRSDLCTFGNVKKKERNVKQKLFRCKFCKKSYSNTCWLLKHERLEHGKCEDLLKEEVKKEVFNCGCCAEFFETKEKLQQHREDAHADVLTCRDCDNKIFSTLSSIRKHRQIFHCGQPRKIYTYMCDKCGKKFRLKGNLRAHVATSCGRSGPKFPCPVCRKDFSSKHARKFHVRVHEQAPKRYVCTFCNKDFHWKGQLKVHERCHTGERPFSCLFCPSSFARRDGLIAHSTLHTGVKRYFCQACGWRFSCVGNLMKHKVTHAATCGAWYKKKEDEEEGKKVQRNSGEALEESCE